MHKTAKFLLPPLGGILTGFAFYDSHLSLLLWFSLVPFFYVLTRCTVKTGIFSSLVFGITYYGVSCFWVGYVSRLGLAFLLLYLSCYPVLFFLLGSIFFKKPLRLITLPSLWVILEFIKENILSGFGWANLGYAQYKNFYLIQVIDIFGVKFLSFLIVLTNIFFLDIISRGRFLTRKTFFLAFLFFSCFLYSYHRLDTLKSEDSLAISLIQPNIPQELKWQRSMIPTIEERLKELGKNSKEGSLVIFPEASWPSVVSDENLGDFGNFASDLKRYILIGAVRRENDSFYNSVFLFQRGGEIADEYRKMKLVPFGEYVPLRDYLTFIPVINSIGDMRAGRQQHVFSYRDKKFSVLICFEDIFPRFVSQGAELSDFLINITNDAWFGGEPQAGQHFGIMVMRAIENRISIVRCANTGISGWVSFRGEIHKFIQDKKEVFFKGVKEFSVSLHDAKSFYRNYPEIFVFFCGIFLLSFFVIQSKVHKAKE